MILKHKPNDLSIYFCFIICLSMFFRKSCRTLYMPIFKSINCHFSLCALKQKGTIIRVLVSLYGFVLRLGYIEIFQHECTMF